MPNDNLTDAIAEAYASAPSDIVILHTLELRHPAFVDENGQPSAIRVVRDNADLRATLEASAPLNGGEEVLFKSFAFEISLPETNDRSSPEAIVTIDNVSREIVHNIELAVVSQEVIKVSYRPYLSTDLSTPQYDPPLHLTLTDITADVFQVSGKAQVWRSGEQDISGGDLHAHAVSRTCAMTAKRHFAAELIGLPWRFGGRDPAEGFDCWGLFRYVQAKHYGLDLPEIVLERETLGNISREFKSNAEYGNWREIAEPRDGCAVLLATNKYPCHVGIWIAGDGFSGVLHTTEKLGTIFSDRMALKRLGWRVAGYYERKL